MASEHVRSVDASNFEKDVVQRSHEVPVAVDFWATWCGPCRVLAPIIEKVAAESQGAFELVNVDVDTNRELAMGFGLRSVPTVMLFVDGAVVDQFIGAPAENEVREFFRKNCPTRADKLLKEAIALMADGKRDEAAVRLRAVLEEDEDNARAHLELARLALTEGREQEVEEHVSKIPLFAEEADAAAALKEAVALAGACRDAGGEKACRERVANDPGDLSACFELGACLAVQGAYREALEQFLGIVERDRKDQGEAARKAMLTVFSLAGVRSELANEFRRKLMILS